MRRNKAKPFSRRYWQHVRFNGPFLGDARGLFQIISEKYGLLSLTERKKKMKMLHYLFKKRQQSRLSSSFMICETGFVGKIWAPKCANSLDHGVTMMKFWILKRSKMVIHLASVQNAFGIRLLAKVFAPEKWFSRSLPTRCLRTHIFGQILPMRVLQLNKCHTYL